ncbi:MAG: GMC family oxidoreductase N-terminal domain-containing protein [Hyphomicrobium sp.]
MSRLSLSHDHLKKHYDVLIIGSGYGGGVAASRLARLGRKIGVLERGREIQTGEFPRKFQELKNDFQLQSQSFKSGSELALFDIRLGRDMHVLTGRGLGGGSLVNAGVALRPDNRVFQDSVWPGQIKQDGLLDQGYARAEYWLRPSQDPRAAEITKYGVLSEAGKKLGHKIVAPRVAVSFESTVNPAGIEQAACTRCGDCCAGCNVSAKNTVAMTYLPDAKRHGAEIFTEITVKYVEKTSGGEWRVHATPTLDTKKEIELSAKTVVLAAGSLGSTEILLRSREKGLSVSDKLGHRFSANGDIIAFGYGAQSVVNAIGVGHPPRLPNLEIGAAVTGQLELRNTDALEEELIIQEGALPSAVAPSLPVMFLPNGRLLGALQSLINGVYRGPFANLLTYFAVSHDSASGILELENDQLKILWPEAHKEPCFQRLDEALRSVIEKCGGEYVKNPLAGTVMGPQPSTAHPLGGCSMGCEAAEGVVNHKSQVFDTRKGGVNTAVHEGLYVIDGSIIPRSLGVNPLFTITALSERAVSHMIADHNLKTSPEQV